MVAKPDQTSLSADARSRRAFRDASPFSAILGAFGSGPANRRAAAGDSTKGPMSNGNMMRKRNKMASARSGRTVQMPADAPASPTPRPCIPEGGSWRPASGSSDPLGSSVGLIAAMGGAGQSAERRATSCLRSVPCPAPLRPRGTAPAYDAPAIDHPGGAAPIPIRDRPLGRTASAVASIGRQPARRRRV